MIDYFEKKKRLEEMQKKELDDPRFAGMTDKEKIAALARQKRQEKMAVEDKISHLERFEKEEKDNPANQVVSALEDFTGPVKERTRTDKNWIYPMIGVLAFLIAHGVSGNSNSTFF